MKVSVVEKILTQFRANDNDAKSRKICGLEFTVSSGDTYKIGEQVDTHGKGAHKAILNKDDETLVLEYVYESTGAKPRQTVLACSQITKIEVWSTLENDVEIVNNVEIR